MDSVIGRGPPPADGEPQEAGRGETMLQLILAAAITVGVGLWAWSLAASAFAGPPVLAPPGIIGVAVEASADTESSPVDVTANYYPAASGTGASADLIFTQILSGAASKRPAPDVDVFLCGPIAQHPDFRTGQFQAVRWRVPSSPDQGVVSGTFGALDQCVYTTLSMDNPLNSTPAFRQALIMGSFGIPASNVSGAKMLYALPGIANWFLPVPLDGLKPASMPPGSNMTINLYKDPGGLTNIFASPQLPDAGKLTWKGQFYGAALPNEEYRLEADSLTVLSQLQTHSFIAGALVGISGGAFVWFVQLFGKAGYRAIAERANRKKRHTEEEKPGIPAGHVGSEVITRQVAQQESEGLGWPG